MNLSNKATGTFCTSVSEPDMPKVAEAGHMVLRTDAIASEKVGADLAYQAADRAGVLWFRCCRWAARATQENKPKRAGVVRAMARSDHWRWVSTPRWARTSWKVTSSCQRRTNHSMTCLAGTSGSVHNRACGSNFPSGSRINTHRMGTVGLPRLYQSAVAELISTERVLPSYQFHTSSPQCCPRPSRGKPGDSSAWAGAGPLFEAAPFVPSVWVAVARIGRHPTEAG